MTSPVLLGSAPDSWGVRFVDDPRTGAVIEDAQLTAGLDAALFAIVEQDMQPCPPDQPLPIARRTHEYLTTCGGGQLI
jgi:inosose dehydratase